MFSPFVPPAVIYQTFGMVILSVFFLIFGYAAQRKIWRTFTRSDGWKSDTDFYMGLIRLNVIIVVCFVCFTTKAVCLYFLLSDSSDSTTENPFTQYGFNTVEWYFMYEWIPDIVPRLALLYLMSRNLSDSDEGGRGALSVSGDGRSGDRRSDAFSDERFLSFDRDTEKGGSEDAEGLKKSLLHNPSSV